MFLNLVKNAAEAAPATGGEIRLATQYTHGLWLRVASSSERVELPITVQIQDNGPGVSPEIAGHLFEPFVSTKRTGSGLGLSLVAKIVGDHGGVVEFDTTSRAARCSGSGCPPGAATAARTRSRRTAWPSPP